MDVLRADVLHERCVVAAWVVAAACQGGRVVESIAGEQASQLETLPRTAFDDRQVKLVKPVDPSKYPAAQLPQRTQQHVEHRGLRVTISRVERITGFPPRLVPSVQHVAKGIAAAQVEYGPQAKGGVHNG